MGSDKKWIYLSYICITLLAAWVLNQLLLMIVNLARIDNPTVMGVLPASAVISVVAMTTTAYFYFRREKVNVFSMEVVQEMRKVTWPTPKGVYMSTIVVVIAVIIMAAILGVFDWLCASAIRFVLSA